MNETEKNCSKLLLDSTHNYQHIQLVFKNVPPSTTFLHLFLWRNSNSDDKKYITSSVEPGEICNIAFIANILLLAKKKNEVRFYNKAHWQLKWAKNKYCAAYRKALESWTIWKEPDSFQGIYVGQNQPQNGKKLRKCWESCFSYWIYKQIISFEDLTIRAH